MERSTRGQRELVENLEPYKPEDGQAGMLPITKSTFEESVIVGGFDGFGGFTLPGHGEKYEHCGEFYHKGCLEVLQHTQYLLDVGDVSNKAFIKRVKSTCLRAACPECYHKWAAKEAHSIERRLSFIKWYGPAKHVIASVPQRDFGLVESDYPKLRRKVYKAVKNVGFKGGSAIFHPYRRMCRFCDTKIEHKMKNCPNCMGEDFVWYFSPHFHFIGFGWIQDTKVEFSRSGYVVVNLGIRETVWGTAFYQLTHCGVNSDFHTVTWFGVASYNKLRVPPDVEEREVCPSCGSKLRRVRWVGPDDQDPMAEKKEGEFWIDPGGWIYGS